MSKRILRMVVPVELGEGSRRNTKNIHRYINKVACDIKEWNKPTEAAKYV